MSAKDESDPAEPAGEPGEAEGRTPAITRFAQYTAPIMLAMLASAGKDRAYAQCSPCL